jgi:YidC/Oxa1 family membrane protein insertase
MTAMWAMFLEVFQVGLFSLTQFYGEHLGSAIVSFTLLARLALLPVTVRMALRMRAHARAMRALKPELVRVRERWRENPRHLTTETLAVYERRGIQPVDAALLKGSLLQTPIFSA